MLTTSRAGPHQSRSWDLSPGFHGAGRTQSLEPPRVCIIGQLESTHWARLDPGTAVCVAGTPSRVSTSGPNTSTTTHLKCFLKNKKATINTTKLFREKSLLDQRRSGKWDRPVNSELWAIGRVILVGNKGSGLFWNSSLLTGEGVGVITYLPVVHLSLFCFRVCVFVCTHVHGTLNTRFAGFSFDRERVTCRRTEERSLMYWFILRGLQQPELGQATLKPGAKDCMFKVTIKGKSTQWGYHKSILLEHDLQPLVPRVPELSVT